MADDIVTAQESVSTDTDRFLCAYCGGVIDPQVHRRRIRTRKFCSDRCRAGWHRARRVALLDRLKRAAAELTDVIREIEGGKP